MNRPDPQTFVEYSFYLAFASSGILTLTLIFGILPGEIFSTLTNIMWLAMITGGIGAFMGIAARQDLRGKEIDDSTKRKMRTGIRVNAIAFVVMLIVAIFAIVVRIVADVAG